MDGARRHAVPLEQVEGLLVDLLALLVRRRQPFLIKPGILVGFAGFGSFLLADSVALYIAVLVLGFTSWFYLPVLMTFNRAA